MPFLEDGELVEVLAKFDGGFVVRREFEEESEEFKNGEPFIVARVFDAVPTVKKENQIKLLEASIEKLKAEREVIREKSRTALLELEKTRREIADFRKMSEEDAALKRVYEMICGKITHVVIENEHRPDVLSAAEARTDQYKSPLRMLTLDGELTWRLSRNNWRGDEYADVVTPCLSHAEALEKVAPFVAKNLANARDVGDLEKAIARSNKIGLPVPQVHTDRLATLKAEAVAAKRRKLEEEMSKLGSE